MAVILRGGMNELSPEIFSSHAGGARSRRRRGARRMRGGNCALGATYNGGTPMPAMNGGMMVPPQSGGRRTRKARRRHRTKSYRTRGKKTKSRRSRK